MKGIIYFVLFFAPSVLFAQTVQENVNTRYSPWSLSAFSLLSSESDQIQRGGNLNSYNYIGPNYRLNSNERVAFKATFNANSAGYDRFNGHCRQVSNGSFEDPFFEYNNYSLGWLPGIADVFWSGRIYLPLSSISRAKGTIARFKSNTIFSRYFTQNLFAEYRNDVSYYYQANTTYFGTHTEDNCDVLPNTGPSNTRRWRMDNWLSLWYIINRDISIGASFLMRDQIFNESEIYDTSRQRNGRMHEVTMYLGPSLRYNFSYNVSFILSYRDVVEYHGFHPDRKDDLVELGEFRSRNTELSLLSFIRF